MKTVTWIVACFCKQAPPFGREGAAAARTPQDGSSGDTVDDVLCTGLIGISYLDYGGYQMPLDAWNYFFFLSVKGLRSQNQLHLNPSESIKLLNPHRDPKLRA